MRKGQTKLYRPVPADFPQVFVKLGWSRIEEHYRAHARTIARWIDICGRPGLTKARRDYVREHGYNRAKPDAVEFSDAA